MQRRALRLSHHHANDWCHLCGEREPTLPLADCSYPDPSHDGGAEHKPDGPRDQYIRICAECGELIGQVARSSDKGEQRFNEQQREYAYRKGVHQAFAMVLDWLRERPGIDAIEALEWMKVIARDERDNTPVVGRDVGDDLIHRVFRRVESINRL